MAGPSLIPGSGGSFNAGGYNPQGQGAGGNDLLQIMKAVEQLKAQKQETAKSQLDTMLTMMDKYGMAPDEKEFTKVAKDAGIPIDTITNATSMKPGQTAKTSSALKGSPQGAQSAFPLASNSGAKNPGGGVQPASDFVGPTQSGAGGSSVPQGGGGGTAVSGQPAAQSPFDAMVARAQERVQTLHATEQQQAHLQSTINDLKQRAGEGDSEAVGQLMNMGGMEFSVQHAEWASATPEQRTAMVGIASGQESVAAKEARMSSSANSLFASGRYTSLADARKAAEGQQVNTLSDLTRMGEEAKLFNELEQAGLSGDQAKEAAQKMANGVSIGDALPKGVSSVVSQQLALQRRQVAAQEAQVGIAQQEVGLKKDELAMMGEYRKGEIQNAANKLLFDLKESNDKVFNERFTKYVDMKRQDISMDKTLEDNMVNELAARSGMTAQKVKGIWDFLGYVTSPFSNQGFHYEFTPNTSADESMLKGSAGAPQAPGKGGITPVGTSDTKSMFDRTQSGKSVNQAVADSTTGSAISAVSKGIYGVIRHPADAAKAAGISLNKFMTLSEEQKQEIYRKQDAQRGRK